MKQIKKNLDKQIQLLNDLKVVRENLHLLISDYEDSLVVEVLKKGILKKLIKKDKVHLPKNFKNDYFEVRFENDLYAFFPNRTKSEVLSNAFMKYTVKKKSEFLKFKNLIIFRSRIEDFCKKLSNEQKFYFDNLKLVDKIPRYSDIIQHNAMEFEDLGFVTENIQEKNRILELGNTSMTDEKCGETLKNKVKKHVKKIFDFAEKNKIQLRIENISESVLVNFGLKAYPFYKINTIRKKIYELRKIVTGVSDPSKKFPYSRMLDEEDFLKINIPDKNYRYTRIYYLKDKIRRFVDWGNSGNIEDFFIDGTRQLISIGTDRMQLMAINTILNKKLFTLAYVFMRDYTTNHYTKIFNYINKKTSIFKYCKSILIDMEMSLISSLSGFGTIRLCYFHVSARMVKWKSKRDKDTNDDNYIRPELIRVGQKIIFIPDEFLDCFFIIIIYMFVEKEENVVRQKSSILFIEYLYSFYVKRLGNKRFHSCISSNLTNNYAESLNAKLKKKLNYKKPNRFVIDACFTNDFVQMAQSVKTKSRLKPTGRLRIKKTLTTYDIISKYQKKKQNIGTTLSFLLNNIDKKREKIKIYNLKKMFLTFNDNQIQKFRSLGKNVHGTEFRVKKMIFYDLVSFFKTSKLKNCYHNIQNANKDKICTDKKIKLPIDKKIKPPVDKKIKVPFYEKIKPPVNKKIKLPVDKKIKVSVDKKIKFPVDKKIKPTVEKGIKTITDENSDVCKIIQDVYTKFKNNPNNNDNNSFSLEDEITDFSSAEKYIISDFMQMDE